MFVKHDFIRMQWASSFFPYQHTPSFCWQLVRILQQVYLGNQCSSLFFSAFFFDRVQKKVQTNKISSEIQLDSHHSFNVCAFLAALGMASAEYKTNNTNPFNLKYNNSFLYRATAKATREERAESNRYNSVK